MAVRYAQSNLEELCQNGGSLGKDIITTPGRENERIIEFSNQTMIASEPYETSS